MKDMLADLNQMLEQRERGEEPDFKGFMDKYGDFFPGNPQTLDELLEQMAQSMAQMQQLLNSMTPEQRAQLHGLAQALLEDLDLRWQVDELARNLQQAFPGLPWNRSLGDLYRKLLKDRAGRHDVERGGIGNEHAFEHKPYEFGDPFHLNVQQTVKNAIWRQGAGTPVRLSPKDFEVERTELLTRSATVL